MAIHPRGAEDNRTLWVGGVERWMDEVYLAQSFSPVGPVTNVKVVRHSALGQSSIPSWNPPGFAFVQFADHCYPRDLLDRLRTAPFQGQDGQRFKVNWATYGIGHGKGLAVDASEVSLYIGNLDSTVTEETVLSVFAERFPSASGVRIVTDPLLGVSRGYGFIRFKNPQEAEDAVSQMQGYILGQKPLRVRRAQRGAASSVVTGAGAPLGIGTESRAGDSGGSQAYSAAGKSEAVSLDSVHVPPPPPAPNHSGFATKGHAILIGGTYTDMLQQELASKFAMFGSVQRVTSLPEQHLTVVYFRERWSAELAMKHLQEQCNVPTILLEHLPPSASSFDSSQGSSDNFDGLNFDLGAFYRHDQQQREVERRSVEEAASQVRHYLKEQLVSASDTGLQHFHVLLQDPCFVQMFERQLSCRLQQASLMRESKGSVRATALLDEDLHLLFAGLLSEESCTLCDHGSAMRFWEDSWITGLEPPQLLPEMRMLL
mmetsp:Transcript_66984/g.139867  ORF Transcript_66984/g.139867 Transcript_66984/m.139867 type:complete len:486 (+) Transcript_66984:126-1583(+)